jgi:hypothetical protein
MEQLGNFEQKERRYGKYQPMIRIPMRKLQKANENIANNSF